MPQLLSPRGFACTEKARSEKIQALAPRAGLPVFRTTNTLLFRFSVLLFSIEAIRRSISETRRVLFLLSVPLARGGAAMPRCTLNTPWAGKAIESQDWTFVAQHNRSATMLPIL